MLSFVNKVAESSEQNTWGLILGSGCDMETERYCLLLWDSDEDRRKMSGVKSNCWNELLFQINNLGKRDGGQVQGDSG